MAINGAGVAVPRLEHWLRRNERQPILFEKAFALRTRTGRKVLWQVESGALPKHYQNTPETLPKHSRRNPSPNRRNRLCQSLVQIGDQIVRVLDSDRQPHHIIARTGIRPLLVRELAMRGRGRVDDQRPGIAKVGHMAE
jgi:hypothetical protein